MSKTEANPYMEQVMRFSSLKKFPMHKEGIKELRDTLRGCAGNPERARKLVDAIMVSADTSPAPRELTVLAGQMKREEEAAPTGCDICLGMPWVTVERVVFDKVEKREMVRQGSQRCDCAKGQWFRAKDRENEAKRAAGLQV